LTDIKDILKVIENAPQAFNDKLPVIEKQIYREISVLLKDLKTTPDGKIESSIENLQLLNNIRGKLSKIVVSKQYAAMVKDFVSQFPVITQMPSAVAGTGLDAETQKMISLNTKLNIDNTLESLIGSGYQQNVVSKLYQTLITNVTSGGSYADMIETLRNSLVSDENGEGLVSRYAKTYVTDALGQFAGQSNKMVADMLDSEWFRYVGSNIETTREFCEHLTKKEWVHKSEIPMLLEGKIDGHECEINATTGLPKGMKEETTPENFIVLRGGWNCGHQLIPTNEAAVPQEVRDRIKGVINTNEKVNINYNNEVKKLTKDGIYNNMKGIDKVEFDEKFLKKLNFHSIKIEVNANSKTGSYFSKTLRKIVLDTKSRRKASGFFNKALVYHEGGHSIAHNFDLLDSDKFNEMFKKHIDLVKLTAENINDKGLNIRRGSMGNADTDEKVNATLDTLMALTSGDYGYGHSRAYFRDVLNQKQEYIAHAFENKFVGNDVFKELMPEIYDDMVEYITDIISE